MNAERFWANVDIAGGDECWRWRGSKNSLGYGKAYAGENRYRSAHRVAYELARGPIPAGLQLDHLCRNRLCVNPLHLEPVTQKENILRGIGWGAENARKERCPRGHRYDYRDKAGRRCRQCQNESNLRYRQRVKARALQASSPKASGERS